jgi:outer membrane protein OmpA-like peptidoglycan-associated protein
MMRARGFGLTLVALAVATACATSGRSATSRLTPFDERLSDEDFARDLAVFGALERRLEAAAGRPTGGRQYLATRAREWLVLAREAYERNDRSPFPDDMIALAERDIRELERSPGQVSSDVLSSAVVFPNNVRIFDPDAWGKAIALRKESGVIATPDEIARAEAMLLRAGHPILSGPACLDDAEASRRAMASLLTTERTRVAPDPIVPDTGRLVVPDRPPPVRADTALPPRPGACTAPERLTAAPRSVHFALDRSDLSAASRAVLDRAIGHLRAYPGVRVTLTGHTDPRASNVYNQALSQRRVDAVVAYLMANGIPADRLRASAFGEERLLTTGTSIQDQARNRRVDVVYTLCDGSELIPDETLDDLQLERVRRRGGGEG